MRKTSLAACITPAGALLLTSLSASFAAPNSVTPADADLARSDRSRSAAESAGEVIPQDDPTRDGISLPAQSLVKPTQPLSAEDLLAYQAPPEKVEASTDQNLRPVSQRWRKREEASVVVGSARRYHEGAVEVPLVLDHGLPEVVLVPVGPATP